MRPHPLRRFLVAACAVATIGVVLVLGAGSVDASSRSASASSTSVVTVTTLPPLPKGLGHIILPPNYGHKPTNPGDRGGWEQSMVFWLVLVSVGLVVFFAWRSSRKARAAIARERDETG